MTCRKTRTRIPPSAHPSRPRIWTHVPRALGSLTTKIVFQAVRTHNPWVEVDRPPVKSEIRRKAPRREAPEIRECRRLTAN